MAAPAPVLVSSGLGDATEEELREFLEWRAFRAQSSAAPGRRNANLPLRPAPDPPDSPKPAPGDGRMA